MKTKTISEVCLVNPRMPASLASQKNRNVDFVPMANVGEDGRITVNGSRKLHEVQKGYTYFQNGDVIVAKITPCMENGKAAYVRDLPNDVGFGSTEFHVLRPQDGLDPAYLFHMIWSPFFRREAARNMTGTAGQQRVPTTFFDRFKIPLPPLPEQRRIAHILDKADAIRRKRQEVSHEYSRLQSAVFIEFFGDPLTNPLGWKMETLGTVVSDKGNGLKRGPFGGALKKEIFVEQGYKVYEQQHAISGDLSVGRYFIDEAKFREMEAFSVRPGDLIVSCSGTMGRVAIVPKDAHAGIINQALLRITPDNSKVTPEYLKLLLETEAVQRYLYGFSRGSGLKNFPPMGEVRALPVPVPSAHRLKQFHCFLDKVTKTGNRFHSIGRESDGLFNSLVQRAFRGEL